MRITTSPGMNRISENTMTLTSTSVGTASASRRRTYCFTRSLDGDRGDGGAGAALELERLDDERELPDAVARERVQVQVLEQEDAVRCQEDLVHRERQIL